MKPRAAPRSPWRPACCAMFPPKRCISASCPRVAPVLSAPRRCARCSMRAPKRNRRMGSRCARNSPSARPSPSSHATCPRAARRCWCSASRTSPMPAAPIAVCWLRNPAGRCSSSIGRPRDAQRAGTRRIGNGGMKNVGQARTQRHSRFRNHAGVHHVLSVGHRAAAAVGAGAQDRGPGLVAFRRGHRKPARAGVIPPVVRRVAGRRLREHGVRLRAGVDAGAL